MGYGGRGLPGYDAWLERPYQDAIEADAQWEKAQEAFYEHERDRIHQEIAAMVRDECEHVKVGMPEGSREIFPHITAIAKFIADKRAGIDRLVEQFAEQMAAESRQDEGERQAEDY